MHSCLATLKREQALDGIIDMVAGGVLQPGDTTSQSNIAQELGLSRTPVREAVAIYAGEGLMTHIPQVGVTINTPSARDIAELLELRYMTERVIIDNIATREPGTPLPRLYEVALELVHTNDALKTDAEVHKAIIEEAGSHVVGQATRWCGQRRRIFHAQKPLNEQALGLITESGSNLVSSILSGQGVEDMEAALFADFETQFSLVDSDYQRLLPL